MTVDRDVEGCGSSIGRMACRRAAGSAAVRARPFLALALVATVLGLAGCDSGGDSAPPDETSGETATVAPSRTEGPGDAGTPPPAASPSASPSVSASAEPSGANGAPEAPVGAEALRPWLEECEGAAEDADLPGEVVYPQSLPSEVNDPATYQAAVVLEQSGRSPEEAITNPDGVTTQQGIRVQCIVGARLLPVGEDVTVEGDPGTIESDWVNRRFTADGTVDWSWAVTATVPEDQQVRLQLRPALSIDDGARTITSDSVRTYVSTVQVSATMVERVAYWFDTQWPLIVGVAGLLAVAVLAVLKWGRDLAAARPGRDRGKRSGPEITKDAPDADAPSGRNG
ncbi:hypothetical protein E7744_01950 [Citricoccus sp. SGAir0253]|uniref:hypothetical protein n=1 Tax=Citricoccus sp. SGAir0253 TaxID=2567881 RepID=UPI0010CD4BC8|nr:hypothetical protein [Citricoccus sp. SGAir0253]QCU77122.1 hypothetical protein E7744_01950 [Citricoccus sp. SGAir0253]